jgi:hypothetical protein
MLDTALDLIQATVQLEQPTAGNQRVVGTGFLVTTRNADGSPQTILITANHVFADMKSAEVKVGYRTADSDGGWSYTPRWLRIRSDGGAPLWTAHPDRDVAAIRITAPPKFARAAIPLNYLASEQDFAAHRIAPGDELFVLGFPKGLAANNAGFPILRSGRVASYPVSPAVSPTFLLDFAVFPGNSGGPVFATRGLQPASTGGGRPLIAGILTQQVEFNHERLEIGVVTHAKYIAETIDLLYGGHRPAAVGPPQATIAGAQPAAATPPPSIWEASRLWVRDQVAHLGHAIAEGWRTLLGQLHGGSAGHPPGRLGPDRRVA